MAKLFYYFVSPHLVRKFRTELDVKCQTSSEYKMKGSASSIFLLLSKGGRRGQNGQSEVSKQDKQQQGKGEREKVCERNVYFHSSPPQDLSCLLVLSPPGSADPSQSINLVWSKACLRLVWLLSAIWLPCYKMANAAQIPNKKNIGLERSENCSRPKTECCHQATLRIRNKCMKKPKHTCM